MVYRTDNSYLVDLIIYQFDQNAQLSLKPVDFNSMISKTVSGLGSFQVWREKRGIKPEKEGEKSQSNRN